MTTSLNIDDRNFDYKPDRRTLAPPKNLKNEITKFNKKLSDKKKLNQTITKNIIDKNLGINLENTQKLMYNKTMTSFPRQVDPFKTTSGFTAPIPHYSSSGIEPIRQNSNSPSSIDLRYLINLTNSQDGYDIPAQSNTKVNFNRNNLTSVQERLMNNRFPVTASTIYSLLGKQTKNL
jgi:hypothetical protein